MTADVTKRVNTIFTVTDKTSRGIRSIGTSVAGLGDTLRKATAAVTPLRAALGLLAGGAAVAGIKSIQGEYENLRIGMAQTAKFMGMGGDSFNDALKVADTMIAQIEVAAAALPGEAEDYSIAMKTAGVNVHRAVGDYKTTFNIVRDMTAIGISMGRGSMETAIQLNRMLDTNRGMMEMGSDFSVDLLNAMKNIPGQANLTTVAFNKMNVKKRVELVKQLAGQYKDMIDESSNTMDAIAGASSTIMKLLTRRATTPIFDAMKSSMTSINDLLMDANGQTTKLADRMTTVAKMASETALSILGLGKGKKLDIMGMLPGGVGGAGMAAAGGAALAGGAGMAALPFAAVAGGLVEFATRTDDVKAVLGSLKDTAMILMTPLGSLMDAFGMVSILVADIFSGALNGLIEGFNLILDPVMFVGSMLLDLATQIMQEVQPVLKLLWEAVGKLFKAIGTFLNPVIRILGFALYGLFILFKTYLLPVFKTMYTVVATVISAFADLLSWIGNFLGKAVDRIDPRVTSQEKAAGKSFIDKFMARIDAASAKDKAGRAAGGALSGRGGKRAPGAARGGGGRAVQDFRFSRFEISQKFAEGFDPDRIAIAFTKDLGDLGEKKLQSGFEPSFAAGV